jgi:hypothetical protein
MVSMATKAKGKAPQPAPQLSMQQVIYMLNDRITKTEVMVRENLATIEKKFGEQDQFVTDNIVDLSQINKAFADLNNRLLEMEHRLSQLESPDSASKPVAKKKGTVKVDLSDPPSFSA